MSMRRESKETGIAVLAIAQTIVMVMVALAVAYFLLVKAGVVSF